MLRRLCGPLRIFRQPLLQHFWARSEGQHDVELRDHDGVGGGGGAEPAATDQARAIHAELLRARWRDWLLGASSASVVLVLMAIVLCALVDNIFSAPQQRGWVLLGLMYYIGSTWNQAWQYLIVIIGRIYYVRVVVGRMEALTLFEAITARLESLADARPADFSSRDVEAFTKYDPAKGVRMVKFNFWGTRSRQFSFQLKPRPGSPYDIGRSPFVKVDYNIGDDVVCGRDSHVERNRSLVLWMKSSPEHVAKDKNLLREWCEECLGEAMAPPPDRVEVYGLQESSSDWVPEWQLERTKALKSSAQAGDLFYLERDVFNELRADAQIWAKRSLRLYMVTGPPGVGKTEFTVWLAGVMRLPIYRLSLTMGSLTDARLAQLLSQNMMRHEAAVVQIDEFQEVLLRWDTNVRSGQGIAVTPGGFNEVLQGSNTLARGVIVLTGTSDVACEAHRRTYPALFRRFQFQIKLGYLTLDDAGKFFRSFLAEFVDNSENEWQVWEAQFCTSLLKHGPKHISIDMIKQFLMRRITEACASGYIALLPGTDKYHLVSKYKGQLAGLLMNGATTQAFFDAYALVDAGSDDAAGDIEQTA